MGISKTADYLREKGKAAAGDRFLLLLLALGLLSALLILLRQINYGPGLIPDAMIYLSVARNLASGNGLVIQNGELLTIWAPLFPTLLAAPERLGGEARMAAGLLNAAATGALVVVVGWYLRRRFGSVLLAWWGALAVLLSIPLTRMGASVATEPVFLLLSVLALLCAAQFLDGGTRRALVWAGVFTALACLTRYVGITIIFAVAPLLLCRRESWMARAQNAALYSVIAGLPVGAWMARNYVVSGTLTGPRWPSDTTLSEYLLALLGTLASWAFPVSIGPEGNALLMVLLGLATLSPAAVAGILAVRQWQKAGRVSGALLVPAVFSLLYIAFLVTSSTFTTLELPTDRYMSPVYVPLVLAVAAIAAYWRRHSFYPCQVLDYLFGGGYGLRWHGWRQSALRAAPLLGLCLGLAHPLATNAADIRYDITDGTGRFSTARWNSSELFPQLKERLAGVAYDRLYSSDVHLLYFHAAAPARGLPASRRNLNSIYQNPAAADGIYVLWVNDWEHYWLEYEQSDLEQALLNPQTLIEDKDGTLYYVSADSIAESIAESKRAAAAATYATAQAMGAPAISAVYDLYIDDKRLIYVKEPCVAADTAENFYLHLHPAPSDRLVPDEQILEYGYNIRDFEFDRYGLKIGAACVASVPYPGYEIARIDTGQYTAAGRSWKAGVAFGLSAFQQMQLDALADLAPVAADRFDIYRQDGKLAYLKEPCAAGDTAALFYLHIVPADSGDLPLERLEHGFDNRDFVFDAIGWSFEGKCLATVELPEYDIALIRTGQYTDAGRLWQSEFPVGSP